MWYFVLMRRMPERKVMRDESDVSGFILSKWLWGPSFPFDKFSGINVGDFNLQYIVYHPHHIYKVVHRVTAEIDSWASVINVHPGGLWNFP